MKNKFTKLIYSIFIVTILISYSHAVEEFTFNVTKLDITQNGNLIVGSDYGKVETSSGIEIVAENFVYNKITNILNASGKVKFIDKNNDLVIFSDKATYLKNDEIVFTEGNSKAISNNNTITGSNFKFNKIENILIAENNVEFNDNEKDTVIYSDKATYLKNDEIVFTEGKTSALIESEYNFLSSDVTYLKNKQELSSNKKSSIKDNEGNIYTVDNFLYKIDKKLLKAINVNIDAKVDTNKRDNYFFSEGFFDLKTKSFVSKKTNIKVHKSIFDNEEQDPRLYGTSSSGDKEKTVINKGIFTSCKLNENCPPWSIHSKKIIHDKIEKNLIYENAILKIYDIPVLYFPKFFHPDPSVKRRTGFLQPQFNRSNTLGSSIYIPYFKTLGIDQDYTFKPTIFEDRKKIIFQNEYRKETKTSSLITDFSLTKGYKSSLTNKKKNINHFFLDYKKNLKLANFTTSNLNLKIERVSNDTYLKVFQNNLFASPVMPENKDLMQTKLNYDFENKSYSLSTGFQIYESLGKKHSDRYQYILPSYDFSKNINFDKLDGSINFYSSGSNNLKDTNNLTTLITNDLEYSSIDYFTNNALKNNFNLYFKNLNSVGKNNINYKASPSIDLMTIFEMSSSLPLIKANNIFDEILTPKISFRLNPKNNMKNYSDSDTNISTDNIFYINRLGISDSFEAGRSLTIGLDYKLDFEDKKSNKDKFLEFKLATVLRDEVENNIPISSTINKKNSNLFGSIKNNLFENLNLGYDFSVDDNLNTITSHSVNANIEINNFITNFDFIEQASELGSNHILSNETTYAFNDNNYVSFSTRRNKEISLTEYYNFSYEYKNDCLVAGIKYNKTFYQDNDLKPAENLFFTITLIPLTTYERSIYEN